MSPLGNIFNTAENNDISDGLLLRKFLDEIYQSGLKFLTPLTPEETYATIVEEAIKLVDAEYGSIILKEQGDNFERVYASTPILYQVKPRMKGRVYSVFVNQKPEIIRVKKTEPHSQLKKLGIKSIILIPLSYEGAAIGVLTALSLKKEVYSEIELDAFKMFGSMATLAINKVKLVNEAKEALETRDLFVSMVSSEISTPVTLLKELVEELKQQKLPNTKLIGKLYHQTHRLYNLVQELLDVDNVRTGKLHYSWHDCAVNTHIKEALQEVKSSYPDYKVIFNNKTEKNQDVLVGDCDKLRQIFVELLSNAAQFSPPQSKIEVTLTRESDFITITVKDQGKGIAEKDMDKLFEKYFPVEGQTKPSTKGFGLYLTKHIIKQHRGIIHIHSKLRLGTTVTVKFPGINYGD